MLKTLCALGIAAYILADVAFAFGAVGGDSEPSLTRAAIRAFPESPGRVCLIAAAAMFGYAALCIHPIAARSDPCSGTPSDDVPRSTIPSRRSGRPRR